MIDTKLNQIVNKRNVDLSKLSRDYYTNPLKRLKRNVYNRSNELIHESDLKYVYVDCNCKQSECAIIFNVSIFNIKHDLRYYKIKKDQNLVKSLRLETLKPGFLRFNKEMIKALYIDQNKSRSEIAESLGLSIKQIKIILKKFKIKKPFQECKEVAARFRRKKNAFFGSISQGETNWLNEFEISERHRQYIIKDNNNKIHIVDGFDPYEMTIYSYLGDFWHGNLKYYNSWDINPVSKKTYGELYKATLEEFNLFVDCGFKVKYIWDSEYKNNFKLKETNTLFYNSGRYFKKGELI